MSVFALPYDSDLSGIAVYNVQCPDYGEGMSPTKLASENATALQAAIDTAQANGGGVILIPSVPGIPYKVQGPIRIGSSATPNATPLIIAGTAQGTADMPLLLDVNDEGEPTNTDLFQVDTDAGSDSDIGGITFENLQIQYAGGSSAGTAIHVIHGQNVRVNQCVFFECPQAVWFEETLQCSMYECTAQNDTTAFSPACVTLGSTISKEISKEIYIHGCTLLSSKLGGYGLVMYGSEMTSLKML